MNIRPYGKEDRLSCITLFSSNVPLYFAEDELNDFEFWLNGKDNNVLSYKNTKEEYFFVLEENGEILACGGFYIPKLEKRINLVWGMVNANNHHMGHGTALLNYRLKLATSMFLEYFITIDTTQLTAGFYEKFNFKSIKTSENYYAPGLHRIDMIKING